MIDNPNIVSLQSPKAIDLSLFGAKAANLAKVAQLGYTVPEGLAVSRLYSESDFTPIAQIIIEELSSPVAVRSSATKEDSETKAFAGQFETRLGIRTTADLTNAFMTVKNSGTTEHVKNYYGVAIPPDQIAVLIQRMVDATRAGVAFSRDPVSGESTVIIESNYGLGKSVVDGDVTPDSIELYCDGRIKTLVGRKSIQINLSDSGIHTQSTSSVDSERCSLTEDEIREIAILTKKVEDDLGFPADIEWAIDSNGCLWLLQARPITTIL